MPLLPILIALLSVVFFALGWRWMPAKQRRAYTYAGLLAFVLLAVGIAGCGGGGSSTGRGKTVTISATYAGNVNYKTSSNSTTILVQ
jgi:hypothetical protein